MANIVEDVAWRTVSNLEEGVDRQEYGSLLGLAALLSILVSVFQLNRICREQGNGIDLREIAKSPSKLQRKMLRREIRKGFQKEHGTVRGYFLYKKYSKQTEKALIKTGAELDEPTYKELQAAV